MWSIGKTLEPNRALPLCSVSSACNFHVTFVWAFVVLVSLQQQQQHNIFSQASWGRLEMKPERNKFKVQACIIKLNICYDLVHWLSPKDRSPANSLFAWWELAGLGWACSGSIQYGTQLAVGLHYIWWIAL